MNEDDTSSIMTTIRRTWKLKFILPARFPYYTEYFNFAYSMKDTLEELVLDLQYNDYSTQLMEFTKSKKIKVTNAPSVQIVIKALDHVKAATTSTTETTCNPINRRYGITILSTSKWSWYYLFHRIPTIDKYLLIKLSNHHLQKYLGQYCSFYHSFGNYILKKQFDILFIDRHFTSWIKGMFHWWITWFISCKWNYGIWQCG